MVFYPFFDSRLFSVSFSLYILCVFPMDLFMYALSDVIGCPDDGSVDTDAISMVGNDGCTNYE